MKKQNTVYDKEGIKMRNKMLVIVALITISILPCFSQTDFVSDEEKTRVQERIDQLNERIERLGLQWTAGVTSLSYLSKDEMKALCGLIEEDPMERARILEMQDSMYAAYKAAQERGLYKVLTAPDWTDYMSLIEEQECGNCWAHAATGVAEGLIQEYYGSNFGLDLDEMDITDNSTCGSCSGAYFLACGLYDIYAYKVPSENIGSYPNYNDAYWTISSFSYDNEASIAAIKSALEDSPVLAGMYVYEDFLDYTSGIYSWDEESEYIGGHAVVIVGYNDYYDYWIVKNSWGTDWGINGYCHIAFGEVGIDAGEYDDATVTSDACYAKLVPNLMTIQQATGYSFVNNEYASILSNVTISSGILTLPNNSRFRLRNNSYIKATGGTIIDNGATIMPVEIWAKNGSTLKGLYPSISSANSNAGTGEDIYIHSSSVSHTSGTVSLARNIYVEGTGSFTISGGTINLSGHYIKSNGGTLAKTGGTINPDNITVKSGTTLKGFYPTVQLAISNATSGQDVKLGNGYFSGNINMKAGVDVDGTGTGAYQSRLASVTFGSGASVTCLSDVRVNGWIEMDNCPAICAAVNVVVVNGYYGQGVEINQSYSAVLEEVSISGIDVGVYVHGTSYPSIYEGAYEDMDEYGLQMAGYGTMNAYGTWFCDNSDYDIYESGSATVYSYYCTWSDNPNSMTEGTVYFYPEPPYHDECGFYRRLAEEPPRDWDALLSRGVDADEAAYREAYEIFEAARQSLLDDWRAGKEVNPRAYAGELTVAIDRFKALAAECSGPVSVRALGAVAACYGLLEDNEAAYNYLTYVANTSRYVPLKPYALSLLVGHYRRAGEFETALVLSDKILAGTIDDNLAGEALYTKGLIYETDLGDSTRAAEMYAILARDYSEHPSAYLAMYRLEEMGEPVPTPKEAEPEVTELSLSGYPNPFNPTTTVRFGLPDAGDVTLIVYDLMGREVVHLAEGYREAGWQQVIWDGRDAAGREVPTGMYLARLVTPQGVKALKLVMMK